LFNPRLDSWDQHFLLEEALIIAKTPIGQVTTNLLRLNDNERLVERALLQRVGKYP
jgi:hypothetical protein